MMMKIGTRSRKEYELTALDGRLMIIILILYGILSFFHLGSLKNPQTFWQPQDLKDKIVLDLGDKVEVSRIRYYSGPRFGRFKVAVSNDNKYFTQLDNLEEKKVFYWQDMEVNSTFRYIVLAPEQSQKGDIDKWGSIGELCFYDKEGNKISATSLNEEGKLVTDEPEMVPDKITYMNTTYFDEIYHGRTAYEYVHGMHIYEWTHPPLGKLIMTLPIFALGMNTFSYRLMGNIAGILMLVVIYIFAKRMFQETKYAALAMLLFAVDGMHFVQTRIGTVDSFLVLFILLSYLFMYQYTCTRTRDTGKLHLNLLLSGIFMGAAMSTKWNGMYTAVGLAVIFFINFAKRNHEGGFINDWPDKRIGVLLACCIYFVAIPLAIYIVSYIPDMLINPQYGTVKGFIGLQQKMFKYHSELKATHAYGSKWYLWPLDIKPIWYYSGREVPKGMVSSIVLHGNPFIWWTGILAMLYTFIKAVTDRSKQYVYITVVILAAYLPYIPITRVMFLYHYFPIVPFMILAVVGLIKEIEERTDKNIGRIYAGIAIIMFAFFYPIYSGLTIPQWYAYITEWLPMWNFY